MKPLTPRELDVLRLVAAGMTDKEIGYRLHLSAHTVAHVVSAARHKLDASSRSQAVATAVREGLVT